MAPPQLQVERVSDEDRRTQKLTSRRLGAGTIDAREYRLGNQLELVTTSTRDR
jgi:hypothetical protein